MNVTDLGCDAYATSAHKWMLAPKGTGLFVATAAVHELLLPSVVSYLGKHSDWRGTQDQPPQPTPL